MLLPSNDWSKQKKWQTISFQFERGFDVLAESIWERHNKGKLWKDIKDKYETEEWEERRQREREMVERRIKEGETRVVGCLSVMASWREGWFV